MLAQQRGWDDPPQRPRFLLVCSMMLDDFALRSCELLQRLHPFCQSAHHDLPFLSISGQLRNSSVDEVGRGEARFRLFDYASQPEYSDRTFGFSLHVRLCKECPNEVEMKTDFNVSWIVDSETSATFDG